MCGIVGYIGSEKQGVATVLDALKCIEYRGYHSAGIAALNGKTEIERVRRKGKIIDLIRALEENPISGHTIIGHTRWACTGETTEKEAHPHFDAYRSIALAHNGNIANSAALRQILVRSNGKSNGAHKSLPEGKSDTEVLAHLIGNEYARCGEMVTSMRALLSSVIGEYAIVLMCADTPNTLFAARRSNGLIIGRSENEWFISSDSLAFPKRVHESFSPPDEAIIEINDNGCFIWNDKGEKNEARFSPFAHTAWSPTLPEGIPHHMLNEIHAQPDVIRRVHHNGMNAFPGDAGVSAVLGQPYERVRMYACGTSLYASEVGAFYMQEYAGIETFPTDGSEAICLPVLHYPSMLNVFTSQSGETADLVKLISTVTAHGGVTLALVNKEQSRLQELAKATMLLGAGPEIGVASTKSFTAQVYAFMMLARHIAAIHASSQLLSPACPPEEIGNAIKTALGTRQRVKEIARKYTPRDPHKLCSWFFLSSHIGLPMAREGSLKLREIGKIHAEPMPAGVLKHGALQNIKRGTPVFFVVPPESPRTASAREVIYNAIELVKTHHACAIALGCEGDELLAGATESIVVPRVDWPYFPLVGVIPLQLLAYETALWRGLDPDKPDTLAKCVTVG